MGKLFFALEVAFVGFAYVMVILFILYLLLLILGRVAGGGPFRTRIGRDVKKRGAVNVNVPHDSPIWLLSDDTERLSPGLVAALAASIYVMLSENQDKTYRLEIASPLKAAAGSRSCWAAEGRKALLERPEKLSALRRKKSCCASSR